MPPYFSCVLPSTRRGEKRRAEQSREEKRRAERETFQIIIVLGSHAGVIRSAIPIYLLFAINWHKKHCSLALRGTELTQMMATAFWAQSCPTSPALQPEMPALREIATCYCPCNIRLPMHGNLGLGPHR